MISLHNFYNLQTINSIYLLLNYFERVILIGGLKIFCINYRISNISKDIINNIFNNDCVFKILPKINVEEFIEYLTSIFTLHNKTYDILLKNTEENYLKFKNKQLLELFIETGYMDDDIKAFLELQFINYFRIRFNDKNKNIIKINSSIRYEEGNYIKKIIEKNNFKKCLEIGFANGISSVYVLMNKDVSLISIDPFQKTQWKSNGIKLLKKLNLNKRHKLIEKKSYEALPELLKKYGEQYFDFIFIDGWHTFDYTLVDFFYSNLLLKINGIIIIDDALHNGVSKCVKYLETNYKFYVKLDSTKTIASFRKIKNDNREWNYHNFF
jgi:predicted O-methyltransferase YrrM